MNRQPIVAGQFYPDNPQELFALVKTFLQGEPSQEFTKLAMVPHAGYIYSGKTCGKTLASAKLGSTILLLGPNHTGRGKSLALWPNGAWLFPGGKLHVNSDLSSKLTRAGIELDYDAHLFEHSLEVILPFLFQLNPNTTILPLCVAEPDLGRLQKTATLIADILSPHQVSIVVSSDLNHYQDQQTTLDKDNLALQKVIELDPVGLVQAVYEHQISMCGILPMFLGLSIAKLWQAQKAWVVEHCTSGDVNRDFSQVVGYAGVIVV